MTTSTPSTPTPHRRSGITSVSLFHPDRIQKGDRPVPVSTAIRASSIWHLMWVRILAFNPSLQIASQSLRDCSDAAGEVSSRYSTPKASNALAMEILVLVSKKALANCSPSVLIRKSSENAVYTNDSTRGGYRPLRVLSIILKLEMLLRKSEALGA